MEPIYLRVRGRAGDGGEVATYPVPALDCLKHSSRHHVYAVVGGYGWPLAECRSEEEACALEEAVLHEIAATILEHQRLADPKFPACIIDLNQVAAGNLEDLRSDPPVPRAPGKFDPIMRALRDVSARLDATLPICEAMPGEGYVCSGCPAEDRDHCIIQEIRDILSRHPVRKEGSILVPSSGGELSAVSRPDYCPHTDGCPGSDCCEMGERCAKAAGRGRS